MESKTDIKKHLKLHYDIIANKILKTDLNTHKPPFIPFTFSEWRRDAFNSLEIELEKLSFAEKQDAKREFINMVDGDLLYLFQKKMKQPYFELVFYENYAIPKGLDFQAARKDYHLFKDLEALANQISEWCIQIEISADLVDRAELYNYFSCEKEEKQIYKDLKEQLQASSSSTVGEKIRKFFKSTLSYSIKSLSNIVWTKGIALSNISMGALILLYYSFIGTSSLPVQILMPRMHISWLVGGIVGSYALNKVADSIERGEVANNLTKITEIFREITLNLIEFNDNCEYSIKDCTLQKTEDDLQAKCQQLKKVIRHLLDNAEKLTEMKERVSKLRHLIEKDDDEDDDLVLIELEDVKIEDKNDKAKSD
ncbi:hypothetical protein ABPG72_003745 [Tetrahymena utriculariae]